MGLDINNKQYVVKTPLLREICFGLRENLSRGTSLQDAKRHHAIRTGVSVDVIEDFAEKPEMTYQRQQEFLDFIAQYFSTPSTSVAPPHEGERSGLNILCISHGGFLKSFLQKYCVPSCDSIANCSVSVVEIEWLSADGAPASLCPKFTMSLLNDVSHL